MKGVPRGRARDAYDLSLNEMGLEMAHDAIHFEAISQVYLSIQMHQNTVGNILENAHILGGSTNVTSDGSITSSFDAYRTQIEEVNQAAQGIIPTSNIRTVTAGALHSIDEQEIASHSVLHGPAAAAHAIEQGKLGRNLDEHSRIQKPTELRRQAYVQAQVSHKQSEEDMETYLSCIESGEFTSAQEEASIIDGWTQAQMNVYDGDPIQNTEESQQARYVQTQEQAKSRIEEARILVQARNTFIGESPEDIRIKLSELAIQHGDKSPLYQKAKRTANQMIAFITPESKDYDPAAYAEMDTHIQQQIKNAQIQLTQAHQASPQERHALLQNAHKTFKTACDSRIALQQKAGVQNPQPITKNEAKSLASTINQTSPDQIIQTIGSLQAQYGRHFEKAMTMVRNLPRSHGLNTAYELAALLPQGSITQVEFVKALLEERKNPKIDTEKPPPETQTALERGILQSPAFAGFSNSLKNTNAQLESRLKEYPYAILPLAHQLNRVQGIPLEEAGKYAAEKVMDTIYSCQDVRGQTLALLRRDPSGKSYTEQELTQISSALNHLPQDDAFLDIIDYQALGAKDKTEEKASREALKQNGSWILSADARTASLVYLHQNQPHPILDQKGNPIQINLHDLRDTPIQDQKEQTKNNQQPSLIQLIGHTLGSVEENNCVEVGSVQEVNPPQEMISDVGTNADLETTPAQEIDSNSDQETNQTNHIDSANTTDPTHSANLLAPANSADSTDSADPTPLEIEKIETKEIIKRVAQEKLETDFILNQEIGGEKQYNKEYSQPTWPGHESGVTIGIGYDLGHNSVEQISKDWKGKVSDEQFKILVKASGITGENAEKYIKQHAEELGKIKIQYKTAMQVYEEKTMPRYKLKTREAFGENYDRLSMKQKTALVSLVFNRGPALDEGRLGDIPALIEKMKEIWENKNLGGLVRRREKEAALFKDGTTVTTISPVEDKYIYRLNKIKKREKE